MPLPHIEENLFIEIIGETENSVNIISEEEALQYGETRFQLKEGHAYEYKFNLKKYKLGDKNQIVSVSKFDTNKGRLNPNIFVGTITLEVFDEKNQVQGNFTLEVQSVKSEYREDYRFMLESITAKCTDLIMQIDSPVNQHFETNFENNTSTLYQQFSFVKSVVDSQEFEEAIQKIVSGPTTRWETENEEKDIRNTRQFSQKNIQQLISRSNRMLLPDSHYLNQRYGLRSIPVGIENNKKTESANTAENKFIKHVLETFLFFCESCETKFEKFSRAKLEANALCGRISSILNQSFFKNISRPDSFQLNSTVLQRKSGYREMLKAWLKFDLAAKLIWKGGDDVYLAGKKDIAILYEYWLFFSLLEILKEVFHIEPKSIEQLISFQKDRISLNLRQGKMVALKGIFNSGQRKLNVYFSYNQSFGGGKQYPEAGSWTTTLRPDYSLSIWPFGLSADDAELKEEITHIHFDAKYKVNNFSELITPFFSEEELNSAKIAERKGTYKNADLLKMHAYKDAIRRTAGAYVLYPGEGKQDPFRGFHELVPGLGAFVLKPNKHQSGKEYLKQFILQVTDHLLDRTSQIEKYSFKTYETFRYKRPDESSLNEIMPEYFDEAKNHKIIPDETFVLVGYCANKERMKWYEEKQLYNFRTNDEKGALVIDQQVSTAKYLLLRESGKNTASRIYKIVSHAPKLYTTEMLRELNYPFSKKPKESYLVVEIEGLDPSEFGNAKWNFKELSKYQQIVASTSDQYTAAGIPFTVSLTELMKTLYK